MVQKVAPPVSNCDATCCQLRPPAIDAPARATASATHPVAAQIRSASFGSTCTPVSVRKISRAAATGNTPIGLCRPPRSRVRQCHGWCTALAPVAQPRGTPPRWQPTTHHRPPAGSGDRPVPAAAVWPPLPPKRTPCCATPRQLQEADLQAHQVCPFPGCNPEHAIREMSHGPSRLTYQSDSHNRLADPALPRHSKCLPGYPDHALTGHQHRLPQGGKLPPRHESRGQRRNVMQPSRPRPSRQCDRPAQCL